MGAVGEAILAVEAVIQPRTNDAGLNIVHEVILDRLVAVAQQHELHHGLNSNKLNLRTQSTQRN